MTDPQINGPAIDALTAKLVGPESQLSEAERALLEDLLAAGRSALLGEATVHTVVSGRRDDEPASIQSIGPTPPPDRHDRRDGPAVQINIWVRR